MIRYFEFLAEAWGAVRQNTLRSLLTVLGMAVGTATIIGVLGISSAARSGIHDTLASFGNAGFLITVDPDQDDPVAAALQYRDVFQVRLANGAWFTHIFPGYQRDLELSVGNLRLNARVNSDSEYHPDSMTMLVGRRIESGDVANAAHICVISAHLAQRLFGSSSAEGNTLRIHGTRVRIVGIYSDINGGLFSSVGTEDFSEIPYTTFHQIAPGPIDFLQAYPNAVTTTNDAIGALQARLQLLHGSRSRYAVQDAREQFLAFDQVVNLLTIGLGAISSVALFTAGMGIMNILLVSVNNRTREIGIRKTIGASSGDIALQFLLEAVILSSLGGAVGTIFGLAITLLASGGIAHFVGAGSVPYPQIILTACVGALCTGVLFGTYPALRAARMDPIVALRS